MVQPIQYQVPGVTDPFASVVQGLRLGSSLAEMDAARAQRALQQQQLQQQIQQRQLAMEQQQRFQQAQQDLLTKVRDKTATFADYQQVASMGDEKQAASALSFFKEMNAQQQSEMLRDGLETMAALETDPAIGVARMREKATALRNSGQDAEAKRMDDAARIAELNPTGAVAAAGVMLSYLPGADKALESYTKLQADRRAAALQPSTLSEAQAKAREAQAKATQANVELRTLANRRDAELRSAQSTAEKAAVEARYADSTAQAALAKSRAETELAIVRTRAAGQEQLPTSARETNWYMQQPPEVQRTWRELKSSVNPPVYNAEARGFIVAPTADNPNGSFIPMGEQIQIAQDRTNAVKALRGVGYNPETGEDNVTRIIKKSTNGGLEALTDSVFRFFGQDTEGARAIAALGSVANQMTLDLSGGKLGAGVSNADREFLLSSLGDLANPDKTVGERIAAWGMARNRMITLGMLPPPKKKAQVAAPSLAPLPGPAPTPQAAPAQMAPAAPAQAAPVAPAGVEPQTPGATPQAAPPTGDALRQQYLNSVLEKYRSR